MGTLATQHAECIDIPVLYDSNGRPSRPSNLAPVNWHMVPDNWYLISHKTKNFFCKVKSSMRHDLLGSNSEPCARYMVTGTPKARISPARFNIHTCTCFVWLDGLPRALFNFSWLELLVHRQLARTGYPSALSQCSVEAMVGYHVHQIMFCRATVVTGYNALESPGAPLDRHRVWLAYEHCC